MPTENFQLEVNNSAHYSFRCLHCPCPSVAQVAHRHDDKDVFHLFCVLQSFWRHVSCKHCIILNLNPRMKAQAELKKKK